MKLGDFKNIVFLFLIFQVRNTLVQHLCLDQGEKANQKPILHPCHGWSPQVKHEDTHTYTAFFCPGRICDENEFTSVIFPLHFQMGRYNKNGRLYVGSMGSIGEDTRCLVDNEVSDFPQLIDCNKAKNEQQMSWKFSQVKSRRSDESKL